MDDRLYSAALNSLAAAAILGIAETATGLNKTQPELELVLDDKLLFDAATMLMAILIEANPEYEDPKRFAKGADMVRGEVLGNIRWARQAGDLLGEKLLYQATRAAGVGMAIGG